MKTRSAKVKMYRSFALIVTMALLSHTTWAQQLSLDESVRLALKNNEEVRNSELDVQASEYQIRQAKSALFPKIDLNGQYLYYLKVPSQYAPASAFGGPEGEYSKLVLNLKQTTSMSVTQSFLVFNQSAFTGLKAAKVVKEASHVQVAVTREQIIYNVTATYYTIQILQDNLVRLEENIANLEKTVKINETLRDNDLIAANVHNRLLINLENLKNQYENQRLSRDKQLTMLKYLMQVNVSDSLEVSPFDYNAELIAPTPDVDTRQRPDIQLQQARIKMTEYDRKSIAAGYYPTLMGNVNYGVTSFYNEFAPGKQINNDWVKSHSIGLSLRIPVFDGFERQNKIRQKDVMIRQQQNALSMMKSNADRELADAMNNYHTHASQLASNKKSLELAEELFTTSQHEFENGITSTTDLLNAQNDLSNARTNYSNALLNAKLAELEWRKASGSLLNDYITENK